MGPIPNFSIILKQDNAYKFYQLEQPMITIGRHPLCNIVLDDINLSRKHATLIRERFGKKLEATYRIFDGDGCGKKSKNGIYIAQERVESFYLHTGLIVRLTPDIVFKYFADPQKAETTLDELYGYDADSLEKQVLVPDTGNLKSTCVFDNFHETTEDVKDLQKPLILFD
ncbi:MAG: FHA domain-containing protein [Cyanobacteria bacterium P01_H01_bin.15]